MAASLALTLLLALTAAVIAWRAPSSRALVAVATTLALVALVNVAYYAHRFDDLPGYFRYRTWWWSDLVPALAGALPGACLRLANRAARLAATAAGVLLALIAIVGPWAKPLLAPLEPLAAEGRWQDGVCMQTTSSTCGPCALANLLRRHGVPGSERELAEEAMTSASGTELWYLARCAERRGFTTAYVLGAGALRADAIVGRAQGATGHFIAITGAADGRLLMIADSFAGASVVPVAEAARALGTPGMSLLLGGRAAPPPPAPHAGPVGR